MKPKHSAAFILCLAFAGLCALFLTGCESVNVGLTYGGKYGTYTVKRAIVGDSRAWDILIDANGKQIVPFER